MDFDQFDEIEDQPQSELDSIYSAIQSLPFEPFEQRDKEALKVLLANPIMRRALNYLLRVGNNEYASTSNLDLLSNQQHLENGLRAQGKVAGIAFSIETLLRVAGYDDTPPEIYPTSNEKEY